MRATTIPYVVDKHLQTYEQMAAYLEAASRMRMEIPSSSPRPGRHRTSQGQDPGGQRLWPFQGEALQVIVWRAQPKLWHYPEGRLSPWAEADRPCEK